MHEPHNTEHLPHSYRQLGPRLIARARDWRESLDISTILRVVRISLSLLGLVTLLVIYFGINWFRDATADRQQWAAAEAHAHHIEEIVSIDFLSRMDPAAGDPVSRELGLDQHITALLEAVGDGSGNAELKAASEALVAATSGYEGAAAKPASDLATPYLAFRGSLDDYVETLEDMQTASLAETTRRGDLSIAVMVATAALGLLTLAGTWWLGSRVREREMNLVSEISDERLLMQTIIDAMPDSIVWKDTESRVQGLNDRIRQRMERQGVTVIPGLRLSDLPMSDDFAAYITDVELLERAAMELGGPIVDQKMTRPEPDGHPRVVLRNALPLRRGDETIGVLSTTRDITEVVELERSLASARRLESVGQLSAGVAHEINTPIQYISDNISFLDKSFTDLLRAIDGLDEIAALHDPEATALIRKEIDLDFVIEEIPDAIKESSSGLDQVARIVRAMKAFAHPGGEIVSTDIADLINSTVDVSRNEWKYHATVEFDFAPDLPTIMCDQGQIKQALLNLIVNAADAIADAGDEIGVMTIGAAADDEWMRIWVTDTGTGIPEEIRERVFDRFFTTKEVGKGTGQGLAITYDAVTSHGGEILIDSLVGKGTTFTVVLPINPPKPRGG